MKADLGNWRAEQLVGVSDPDSSDVGRWADMEDAIDLLQKDVEAFLRTYLCESPDGMSKGLFSVTSR
jgi:hypothetical protein